MKKNELRKKILIAEDEIIIALDLKNILKNCNFKICSVVFSGEEAIKKASEEKPNLILMDIMLQGSINGIQAAEAILKENNIPIIFLTAVTDREKLLNAGITKWFGFINKPYDEQALCAAIENVLTRKNRYFGFEPELCSGRITDFRN